MPVDAHSACGCLLAAAHATGAERHGVCDDCARRRHASCLRMGQINGGPNSRCTAMFPVPFYFLPFYHFTSIFDFTSRAAPSHSEPLRGTHWGPSCIFWLCVLVHILAVLAASPLCIFWPRLRCAYSGRVFPLCTYSGRETRVFPSCIFWHCQIQNPRIVRMCAVRRTMSETDSDTHRT